MDAERVLSGEWMFHLNRMSKSDLTGLGWVDLAIVAKYQRIAAPLFRSDHAEYVKVLGQYARWAQSPYWEIDTNAVDRMMASVPNYCIITRFYTPSLEGVGKRHASLLAQVRITRAGLALLRHRQVQGTFPETLDGLRSLNLVDPFSGQPLIYHPKRHGFVLYSVGWNRKDDGGKPRPATTLAGEDPDAWDIVWQHGMQEGSRSREE